MRHGAALVISAPSGAGKSTLCGMLRAGFPDFGYSVSCTTRPMRPGETEGRDYFFVTERDFERMRLAGELAEWARVHDHYYGTPLAPVRNMLNAGKDVLFDIDVQGAAQLKASLPGAVFIFILPPSLNELRRRLLSRGCDDKDSLNVRMANATAEIRQAFWYDAIITNDDLNEAYAQLVAVYTTARLAPFRNAAHLRKLLAGAGYGGADNSA